VKAGGKQINACFSSGFLLRLFFNPEDVADMFLQNTSSLSVDYSMLYSQKVQFFNATTVRTLNPTKIVSIEKCMPLELGIGQFCPFHTFTFFHSKILFNMKLPFELRSPIVSLSFRFSDQIIFICCFPHEWYVLLLITRLTPIFTVHFFYTRYSMYTAMA
jgi:hypothetical protein